MSGAPLRMYGELAPWWPLLSDPADYADYVIALRERGGEVRVELDRHLEGLFGEAEWLDWFRELDFAARVAGDKWGRRIFVGEKRRS